MDWATQLNTLQKTHNLKQKISTSASNLLRYKIINIYNINNFITNSLKLNLNYLNININTKLIKLFYAFYGNYGLDLQGLSVTNENDFYGNLISYFISEISQKIPVFNFIIILLTGKNILDLILNLSYKSTSNSDPVLFVDSDVYTKEFIFTELSLFFGCLFEFRKNVYFKRCLLYFKMLGSLRAQNFCNLDKSICALCYYKYKNNTSSSISDDVMISCRILNQLCLFKVCCCDSFYCYQCVCELVYKGEMCCLRCGSVVLRYEEIVNK